MIELVRFQSANYSNYYFRYAIDDDTVSVIKCATNSISVDGDNVKSSRCSLVSPTIFDGISGFDDCASAFAFTAITDKQYDMYLQLSTDQETWTNFSSQLSLTFYNNGTEYIGCLPSLSNVLLTGGWGSTIENGITIVSTHENIIQNDTVLTEQQWYALIASDPKEYLWKVQSPDGKIYHIRDAEAKEILDNLETFEVDVDSHVLHINGDSAAGGGSTHTYSTTEQVVGTWIDGKPLYEKTWEFTIPDARDTYFFPDSATPNLEAVYFTSYSVWGIGERGYVPWYNNGTILFSEQTATAIEFYFVSNAYAGRKLYYTSRYTKTTD